MHPAYPRVPPVPPVPRVPQVALACVRACRSAHWLSAFAGKNRFEPLLCADPNQPVSVAAGRCNARSCGNGVRYHGTYVYRSCDACRSKDAAAQVWVRQQAVAPFAAPAHIAPAACCRRCRYSPAQRRQQVVPASASLRALPCVLSQRRPCRRPCLARSAHASFGKCAQRALERAAVSE
jgi:hypothetical protein